MELSSYFIKLGHAFWNNAMVQKNHFVSSSLSQTSVFFPFEMPGETFNVNK